MMEHTYQAPTHLYQACRYAGSLWHVAFENQGHVHLTSYDGLDHARNIHLSQVQFLDEFQDLYPEE